MMDIMAQCELPSGNMDDDLGLTLSPGSQSRSLLSESHSLGQPASMADMMDLSELDAGMLDAGLFENLDFDVLTDFDPHVHQIEIPTILTTSGKRSLEDASDTGLPPKRVCHSLEPPSLESLASQTRIRMDLANDYPLSAHASPSPGPPTPASTDVMTRFAFSPQDVAQYVNSVRNAPAKVSFSSPYRTDKYCPSAPTLHNHVIHIDDSDTTLQNRLTTSHRRIKFLVMERNRYRDRLLNYCKPNPITGKLRINEMEAELSTLRRVTSTQQSRTNNLKAEIETWRKKYTELATTHNSLVADYSALQQSATTRPQEACPLAHQVDNGRDRSITAPPKDATVIDLTDDSADTVSTPITAQDGNPGDSRPKLTDFRVALRAKELDWLRSPPTDQMASQDSYQHIFHQQVSPTRQQRHKPAAPSPEPEYNPSDDELLRMLEEELTRVSEKDDSEEGYNPSDAELARMLEEELAK